MERSGQHYHVRTVPTIQFNNSELLISTWDNGGLYVHGSDQHIQLGEKLDEILGQFHGLHEKELEKVKANDRLINFAVVAVVLLVFGFIFSFFVG